RAASFTHEHLNIIEKWLDSRYDQISVVHREFIFCLKSYIRREGVYLCEARLDGALVGLSVFATIGAERIAFVNSFPLRGRGHRVGDALFAETISFARKNSLCWIHLGYSATKTLLAAKEAWGSQTRSAPYREAFYAIDDAAAALIREEKFLWRLRLS